MSDPVRLECWSLVPGRSDPYLAPELRRPMLQGFCYGHQRFPDGTPITTGTVMVVEGNRVSTKRTTYLLGAVDPNYEDLYPGALERLKKVKPAATPD